MVGRIGAMLGEADVNISAMHLGAHPAARGRADDPGPRRRRPAGRRAGHPRPGRRPRPVDDPPGARALNGGLGSSRTGLDATLVLVRHGESRVHRRGPVPGPGRLAADASAAGARPRSSPRGSPHPHVARRCPSPPARPRLVHSPLGRTTRDRRGDRGGRRGAATAQPVVRGPMPGFLEIGQGDWEGLHRDEIAARYGDDARRPGAADRPRPGRPAANRSTRSRRGSGRRSARLLADLAAAGVPGTRDRDQVAGLRRRPGEPPVVDRRRPRRRVQGHAADAVRPAARAVLDVVDGPVRDHGRRVPGGPGPSCARTT